MWSEKVSTTEKSLDSVWDYMSLCVSGGRGGGHDEWQKEREGVRLTQRISEAASLSSKTKRTSSMDFCTMWKQKREKNPPLTGLYLWSFFSFFLRNSTDPSFWECQNDTNVTLWFWRLFLATFAHSKSFHHRPWCVFLHATFREITELILCIDIWCWLCSTCTDVPEATQVYILL